MNKSIKVIILVVLAILISATLYLKGKNASQSAPQTTEAPSEPIQEKPLVSNELETAKEVTPSTAEVEKVQEIKQLPTLLDLGADKCIPCKAMAPILEELKEEYKETINVKFIDVWKYRSQAEQYRIRVIPTQIFIDSSGTELFRHEGFYSKAEILSKFRELGMLE